MPWIWVDNNYGAYRRNNRSRYRRRYRRSYARSYDSDMDEDRYDADESDDDTEDDIYDDGMDDSAMTGNYSLRRATTVMGRNGRPMTALHIEAPADMLPPMQNRYGYAQRRGRARF